MVVITQVLFNRFGHFVCYNTIKRAFFGRGLVGNGSRGHRVSLQRPTSFPTFGVFFSGNISFFLFVMYVFGYFFYVVKGQDVIFNGNFLGLDAKLPYGGFFFGGRGGDLLSRFATVRVLAFRVHGDKGGCGGAELGVCLCFRPGFGRSSISRNTSRLSNSSSSARTVVALALRADLPIVF